MKLTHVKVGSCPAYMIEWFNETSTCLLISSFSRRFSIANFVASLFRSTWERKTSISFKCSSFSWSRWVSAEIFPDATASSLFIPASRNLNLIFRLWISSSLCLTWFTKVYKSTTSNQKKKRKRETEIFFLIALSVFLLQNKRSCKRLNKWKDYSCSSLWC